MAKTSDNVLVKWLVAVMFIAMLSGAKAFVFCEIESDKLDLCYAAVTGEHPPKPSKQCCDVVKHANLRCLCKFKNILPAYGINSTNVLALPRKCGLQTAPECRVI